MTADELKKDAVEEFTAWQRHRFFGLIAGVLMISMMLVAISLSLYNSSGAAQVDLSLPGYQAIQKQASQDRTTDAFEASGALDTAAFDLYDTLYSKHLKRIGSEDYDSSPLGDDSLQLFANPATQTDAAADVQN